MNIWLHVFYLRILIYFYFIQSGSCMYFIEIELLYMMYIYILNTEYELSLCK